MEPLKLSGEIDVAAIDEIRASLTRSIEALDGNGAAVEIDCSELEFIDSSGLGMLVGIRKQTGKELVLVNVPNERRKVFELTGLDRLFELR
jgi:anti-sigma B factor antagonist